MRDHQHQPRAFQPVHHETQRLERHGIGPVQVFDDDQQRRQRQAPLDDGADRVEDLPPQLLGLDMPQGGVGVAEAEHMVEQRHQPLRLLACQAEIGQQGRELRPHFARRVVQHHPGGAAHDRADGAIGLFAQRRAGCLPHGDVLKALLVADAGDEFVHQPRFSDSGFADEADKLRRAAARQVQARQHALELGITADQRRARGRAPQARAPARGEASGSPSRCTSTLPALPRSATSPSDS